MNRFAVFGDAYVTSQGTFRGAFQLPGEVRFIGRGGMRVNSVPDKLWEELLNYDLTRVILHLGGQRCWLVH